METRSILFPGAAIIPGVPAGKRFSKSAVAGLTAGKILGIRAGVRPHRFLGIWVVVVDGRVFVRSWNDKATGWHKAFRADSRGAIQYPGHERPIAVRARRARGERLLNAIDRAYAEKYDTQASRKYVVGLATPRRRATTIELVPR